MKVDKIKKTNSGKYKVIFDDDSNVTTYDDVIIKNDLLFKKELDNNTLNQINIDTKYYNNYLRVIRFITFRLRSRKEINDYCEKLELLPEEKEAIITSLTKEGLINDSNFMKAFIADKINFSSLGPYRIKDELINHNIDSEMIDNYMITLDSNIFIDKINKYIIKKIKSNTKYSNYVLRQKLYGQLMENGFDSEMINTCLDNNLNGNNNQALEKEFNKIYRQLENKYHDEELIYRLKNKLYQRGFSISDINTYLEKL